MGKLVEMVLPLAGVTADLDYFSHWKFKADLIIVGIGLCLSMVFLVMRIYIRACLWSKFGWDNVSMTITWEPWIASKLYLIESAEEKEDSGLAIYRLTYGQTDSEWLEFVQKLEAHISDWGMGQMAVKPSNFIRSWKGTGLCRRGD